MGVLIILLIITGCGLLGHWLIKALRKTLAADRERRRRIADGIFDRAQDACPKSPQKRRRWFKRSGYPSIPETILEEFVEMMPPVVEALLKRHHAHLKAYRELHDAYLDYQSKSQELRSASLMPGRFDRFNESDWFSRMTAAVTANRLSGRNLRIKDLAFAETAERQGEAVWVLTQALTNLSEYDLENLSPDEELILDLSRQALGECKSICSSPSKCSPAAVLPQPAIAHPEVDALSAEILDKAKDLLASLSRLSTCIEAIRSEHQKLMDLRFPLLPEPQRPIEEEVARLLEFSLSWAEKVQSQERVLKSLHDEAVSALFEFDWRLADVDRCLPRLLSLEKSLSAITKSWGIQPGAGMRTLKQELYGMTGEYTESPDILTTRSQEPSDASFGIPNPKTSGLVSSAGSRQKARSKFDLPDRLFPTLLSPSSDRRRAGGRGLLSASRKQQAPVTRTTPGSSGDRDNIVPGPGSQQEQQHPGMGPSAEPLVYPRAPFTDEQFARKQVIEQVLSHAKELSQRTTQCGYQPLLQISFPSHLESAVTEADRSLIEALTVAMRKLSYAVAQYNAALEKYSAVQSESNPVAFPSQPQLSEPTLESYLRSHRKWLDEVSRNQKAEYERMTRLEKLQEQCLERKRQMLGVSEALGRLLEPLQERESDTPAELDRIVRAARLLRYRYCPTVT